MTSVLKCDGASSAVVWLLFLPRKRELYLSAAWELLRTVFVMGDVGFSSKKKLRKDSGCVAARYLFFLLPVPEHERRSHHFLTNQQIRWRTICISCLFTLQQPW